MNTEKLHAKLVDLLTYLEKTKEDKKASNQGFAEILKDTQKKIDGISKALKTGDQSHLYEGYSYDEIESLLK